ncbi:MAG: TonB-dependent receptor plug domain-containing protein [Bacteroidia bacterium]|nr:TonB-dependent receptor plug domain-containing protein [Bacteroidia bacterium]
MRKLLLMTAVFAASFNVALRAQQADPKSEKTDSEEKIPYVLGIQKSVNTLPHAVFTLSGEELLQTGAANLSEALNGRVAGLEVLNSGSAAGSPQLNLRGIRSLQNGENSPIVILDGVEIDYNLSDLSPVNFPDIASVTLLKGPAATALYGNRGANGAIIVTSKRLEKTDGIRIGVNITRMQTDVWKSREQQNLFGEGKAWEGSQDFETDDQGASLLPRVDADRAGASWGPAFDNRPVIWWNGDVLPWESQPVNTTSLFQPGLFSSYHLSLSGANENGGFRGSLTQNETTSILPNHSSGQTLLHLRTHLKPIENTEVNASVNFLKSQSQNPTGLSATSLGHELLWNRGRSFRPELEENNYENADGSQTVAGVGFPTDDALGRGRGISGPFYWNLNKNQDTRQTERMLGSLSITRHIRPWLSLTLRSGTDYANTTFESRQTPTDTAGLAGGRYALTLSKKRMSNHTLILEARKNFTRHIHLSAFAGMEKWATDYQEIRGSNGGFDFRVPDYYAFWNAYTDTASIRTLFDRTIPGESRFRQSVNAVFAFADLNIRDRYFLSLSTRTDRLTTPAGSQDAVTYPSAGLGYVFRDVARTSRKVFTYGKLRLSYAFAGNPADIYSLHPQYFSGIYTGIFPTQNLVNEKTQTKEFGLEMAFYHGRIRLDGVYFESLTDNQILPALSSDGQPAWINGGEIQNKGLELTAEVIPVRRKGLEWRIQFSGSGYRNEVISLAEGGESVSLGGMLEARVGQPMGAITGYDYVYFDQNGNSETDPEERTAENRIISADGKWYETTDEKVVLGNVLPKWYGGITNTISFMGLTFRGVADIRQGGDVFWGSQAAGLALGQSPATLEGRNAELGGLPYTDVYGAERNIGVIKEGVYADGKPNQTVVPYYYKYQDVFSRPDGKGPASATISAGSWVRVRELSLTYHFPENLLKKNGTVKGLSLTAVGRNLWFIRNTAPDGLDPAGVWSSGMGRGMESGQLPTTRSWGVVVNMGF